MPAFVAGVVILGLLLLLAGGYTRVNARQLARGVRFSGGLTLGLAALGLVMIGRPFYAFLAAGGAWALLFGTVPPWLRPSGTGYGGTTSGGTSGSSGPPRSGAMSRAEALKVLGLEEDANDHEVKAAHRRLILQTHPDKGGTSYLAAKINEAKEVLLGRRR